MISIVLPVYNGEKSLEKSINSILNQTYKDFELIIVNDCSTDSTAQIIENARKKDSRVKCITNEVNQKLPNSLNIGFSYAKGKYFTWTSHDNMYYEDALRVMYNALEKDSNIGMVYCDFIAIDDNDQELAVYRQDEPDSLAWSNPIGACFMYKRDVAEKVGDYDENLFLAEDYEYWLRIWENSNIIHIPQILYFYRIHDKSLTETRKQEVKYKTVEVWIKHWDYILSRLPSMGDKLRFYYKSLEMAHPDKHKKLFIQIIKKSPVFVIYYLYHRRRENN